jgi:hypothetical protein
VTSPEGLTSVLESENIDFSTDEGDRPLHIITKKELKVFWEKYPDAEAPLRAWYKVASRATWQNLAETRQDSPHADPVGECTVFNIGLRGVTSEVINGKRKPSKAQVRALAEFFKLPPDVFVSP